MCFCNLLEWLERVNKTVEQRTLLDIIYLGFQKAFDKVPHKRLLRKINIYRVRGSILLWIKNCLSNRKQRAGVNECSLGWREVKRGGLQGPAPGLVLFNIFINGLEEEEDREFVKSLHVTQNYLGCVFFLRKKKS